MSQEFKAMAKENGFVTFGDIITHGANALPELPKSNHGLLIELLGWLEENGLLELADRIEEIDC